MTQCRKQEKADLIEKYWVALTNVSSNTTISEAMALMGYDEVKIQEDKDIFTIMTDAYDANKLEDKETEIAYSEFESAKLALVKMYSKHRKIARVTFRNQANNFMLLELQNSVPEAFAAWFFYIKTFYTRIRNSADITAALSEYNVTQEDITNAISLCDQIEQKRTDYLREVGESQDATKIKDKAISDTSLWMRDFYEIVKIALEDSPQLLESLGAALNFALM